jgi:hypothetical protein
MESTALNIAPLAILQSNYNGFSSLQATLILVLSDNEGNGDGGLTRPSHVEYKLRSVGTHARLAGVS